MVWIKSTTSFSPSPCLPDLTIVTHDGAVSLHSLVLVCLVPESSSLLCQACLDNHEHVTIIVQEVSKQLVEKAVKKAYRTGEGVLLAEVIGMKGIEKNKIVTELFEVDSDSEEYNSDDYAEEETAPTKEYMKQKENFCYPVSEKPTAWANDEFSLNETLVTIPEEGLDWHQLLEEKFLAFDDSSENSLNEELIIANSLDKINNKTVGSEEKDYSRINVTETTCQGEVSSKTCNTLEVIQSDKELPIKRRIGRPRKIWSNVDIKTNRDFDKVDITKRKETKLKTYSRKRKLSAHISNSQILSTILPPTAHIQIQSAGIDCESPKVLQQLQNPGEIIKEQINAQNFDEISHNVSLSLEDTTRRNYFDVPEENDTTTYKIPFELIKANAKGDSSHENLDNLGDNLHKQCSNSITKRASLALPKLPYGWTKSFYTQKSSTRGSEIGTRLNVMFRSPANDLLRTKPELKRYLAEHCITFIDLDKFDFCPYNAGKFCEQEIENLWHEVKKLSTNLPNQVIRKARVIDGNIVLETAENKTCFELNDRMNFAQTEITETARFKDQQTIKAKHGRLFHNRKAHETLPDILTCEENSPDLMAYEQSRPSVLNMNTIMARSDRWTNEKTRSRTSTNANITKGVWTSKETTPGVQGNEETRLKENNTVGGWTNEDTTSGDWTSEKSRESVLTNEEIWRGIWTSELTKPSIFTNKKFWPGF